MADYAIHIGGRNSGPSWLNGVAVNEWVEIPSTNFTSLGVDLARVIDAWSPLVHVPGTGLLVSSANGGHTDTYDNGVYSIDLLQNSPSWTVQIPSSTVFAVNVDHYPDGKPVSRHGYQHAHYISQRSRIMLFGARETAPNAEDGFKVDGHTVTGTWAWDAADTWLEIAGLNSFGIAHDPTTGNVLTNSGRLWDQATNTWSQPAGFSGGWRWPVAFDTTRNEFFALQWRDGQNLSGTAQIETQRFSRTNGAATAITWTAGSASALAQFATDAGAFCGMGYDPDNDKFLWYDGRGSRAGRVYSITPNGASPWEMVILSTTGTPTATNNDSGINGRFRYIPSLGGFAMYPTATSNMWFLRTV